MAMDGWDLEDVDTDTGEIRDPVGTPSTFAPGSHERPRLSMDVNELAAALAANPEALAVLAQAINGDGKKESLNVYATAAEFVELWFVRRFPQVLTDNDVVWCDHWWKHPEGRAILEWMWEDWEEQRKVAGRMLGWFMHTAKPAKDYLFSAEGPFSGCKKTIMKYTDDGRLVVTEEGQHIERRARLSVGLAPDELFIPVPTKQNPNP